MNKLVTKWRTISRQDDCFYHMVPSDVRVLLSEIEKLSDLLVEHHQHHMMQGDIIYEDGKGGYGTFDGADAYSESDLGERTYEAIPYPSSSDTPETTSDSGAKPDEPQNTDINHVSSTDGDLTVSRCEGPCRYSRRMDQEYPRSCVECGCKELAKPKS